jgi:tetratricopeptide (TPR) repeat protein
MTHPECATHAGDVFYVTAPGRKWIASPESDGIGLLEYSTPELIGRKTFFWGQKTGGRNWNRHLCGSDRAYIEIQAGLRYMQMEHIPMEPNSTITFTECYTALNMDKSITHGDRIEASKAISELVNSMPDPKDAPIPLDREKTVIHLGSGFGALEGEKISNFYPFPKESLGAEQAEWLFLEENGYLKEPSIDYLPISYRIDEKTLDALIESTKKETGDHWYTYLHIGIIKYALGDSVGALDALIKSIEKKDNPASRRNLSALYKNVFMKKDEAIKNIERAYELSFDPCRGLVQDLAKTLTALGEDERWLEIYPTLNEELRERGRLKLYTAIALVNLGRIEDAKKYVNEDFEMPDVKEGELSVSAVWKSIYGDSLPLPDHLNFRMYER